MRKKQRLIRKGRDLGFPRWTDWFAIPALVGIATGIVIVSAVDNLFRPRKPMPDDEPAFLREGFGP